MGFWSSAAMYMYSETNRSTGCRSMITCDKEQNKRRRTHLKQRRWEDGQGDLRSAWIRDRSGGFTLHPLPVPSPVPTTRQRSPKFLP